MAQPELTLKKQIEDAIAAMDKQEEDTLAILDGIRKGRKKLVLDALRLNLSMGILQNELAKGYGMGEEPVVEEPRDEML